MKKEDELVWVFPTCVLDEFKGFPGVLTSLGDGGSFKNKVLRNCRFMRRGDVEEDPTTLQVIPYILVWQDDSLLVYNRGSKGGEERLADKWSIGVGGHINPEDDDLHITHDPIDTFIRAARRELTEELTPGEKLWMHPLLINGYINLDITPVDAVHFGVVIETMISSVDEIKGSSEIEKYQWVTVEELKNYKLESWSKLVYEEILLKE
jgi:predicted NUDIX family phosphoesterase